MNAIVQHRPPASVGLVPNTLSDAFRMAEIMATAKLVPVHLQGKPGDCLLVIEQATRWGMSPFAVAQSTSVISGKLMFEGKLVAAAVQASGAMEGRFSYDFTGQGDSRTIKITGKLRGDAEPKSMEIVLRDVKTTNGMWVKQPDQQLVYSANRNWARRFCPEIMLGVYSPDEFDGPTIEHEPRSEPTRQPAALSDGIPTLEEPKPEPTKEQRAEAQVAKIAATLDACRSEDDILAYKQTTIVQAYLSERAFPESRDRVNAMFKAALDRFNAPDSGFDLGDEIQF